MRCPHCGVAFHLDIKGEWTYSCADYSESGAGYSLCHGFCPDCNRLIVLMRHGKYRWVEDGGELVSVEGEEMLYPKQPLRLLDSDIPSDYLAAFNEANAVLFVSPKASAALARRLLQQILREEYKVRRSNLAEEISEFASRSDVPGELAGEVNAVRQVGNFAAHPLKVTNTGEIVDVEADEAEWTLEVLEHLLQATFVEPKRSQVRRDRLNQKLSSIGKPPSAH